MEGVETVPFKHNSQVVEIKRNIDEHFQFTWFPEFYYKENITVPSQSIFIYGKYDVKYKDDSKGYGTYNAKYKDEKGERELGYRFKEPYRTFVEDMVPKSFEYPTLVRFNENSQWIAKVSSSIYKLSIEYYDTIWKTGIFKKVKHTLGDKIEGTLHYTEATVSRKCKVERLLYDY